MATECWDRRGLNKSTSNCFALKARLTQVEAFQRGTREIKVCNECPTLMVSRLTQPFHSYLFRYFNPKCLLILTLSSNFQLLTLIQPNLLFLFQIIHKQKPTNHHTSALSPSRARLPNLLSIPSPLCLQ